MKLYKNFNILKKHKESIILIGNFDGVHLGHQKLFKLANDYKKKNKCKIGVVTFEPMPKMYFNKSIKNFRITSTNQKKKILNDLGVDFIVTKNFDSSFSKIKSNFFIKEFLFKKLKAKYIFVSNNFKFGNNREGNVKELIKNETNFNYKIVKPIPLVLNNRIISSTFIRNLLEKGKLKKTNILLKRNWTIEGIVRKGRQQGKKIGFPTCNIDIKDYVIAMPGVYAVKVKKKIQKKLLKQLLILVIGQLLTKKKSY